jgi:hypothetical protein
VGTRNYVERDLVGGEQPYIEKNQVGNSHYIEKNQVGNRIY